MAAPDPLSAEQLAASDAAYKPIPAFGEWPQSIPRPELWQRSLSELDELKAKKPSERIMRSAIDTTLRTAAFDTGAIEGLYKTDRGLTITVATQAAAWQADLDTQEPDARPYFEAQLEAYELVLDVTTQSRPVTEVWIRHLHEILTRPQLTYTVQTPVGPQERPLPRGEYKSDPNHVQLNDGSIHSYAPVAATGPEMGRLVDAIGSEEFGSAHPATQAAYMHYCLAAIHPFADGNGRVARAVASVYLYRAASVPLLILADQRTSYFLALEAADRGDFAPFVKFVAEAAGSAVGITVAALRTALSPQASDAISALGSLLSAQGGLTHHELDQVGTRLQGEIDGFVSQALEALELPPGVSTGGFVMSWNDNWLPPGFRRILAGDTNARGANFQSSPPAQAETLFAVVVAVATSDDDSETFALFNAVQRPDQEMLILTFQDVYPQLSAAAQFRIRAYIDRVIGSCLAALVERARAQLEKSGYRSW